jgi:hypothetical protein
MAENGERVGFVVQLPDGTYLSGGDPPVWSDEAFTVFPEYIDADAEVEAHETSFMKRIVYRFLETEPEVSGATEAGGQPSEFPPRT